MKKENGLTMIELLATIAILVATVTVVLSLGNRAVAQAGLFAAHTQATFLAKEAMEVLEDPAVRGEIETEGESFWKIDYQKIEETMMHDCYNKRVKINNEGYFFIGGTSEAETNFSRCVKVQKLADELEIEVDVAFDYGRNSYNVKLYRIFYE